ncbi:hypothetical protein SAMN03159475_0109 [Pseudomonas sp. NFPP33]|nr:hypothetical protein [Pseudomonas sp. NFPP33]AGH89240.1 hypothetical protein [uncultured bacterium]SDA85319.1 hypothetical protein SAMN03159475_0109 [Pseudomonas sp. NFPP33]
MSGFELEQYKEQFKAIVLNHLENVLPSEEWETLRAFCQGPRIVDEPANPGATRQEVLAASLCESGLSPADILKGRYKALAVQIGEIESHPVFYVQTEGYYFWGLGHESRFSMDVTVSWPAYPPSW